MADESRAPLAFVVYRDEANRERTYPLAIAGLPHNQKRARLVVLALDRGLVDERDLTPSGPGSREP